MHLFIGIITILYLAASEANAHAPVEDVWTRIYFMLLITASVPCLAMFQTAVIGQRFKNSNLSHEEMQASWNRISICHAVVWLTASLMVVLNIQWQAIVRNNFGLNQWPLIDELLILLPVVFSLVASWAVFFDVRSLANAKSPVENAQSYFSSYFSKDRWAFVLVRLRVYVAMTLLPIAIFVLMRDFANIYNDTPTLIVVSTIAVGLLVVVGYPVLIGLIWNLRPSNDPELNQVLQRFCKEQQLRIRGIKIWNTENQILNAMVAGLVPYVRTIILTDGLINRFPRNEMIAILRHEAGHIRLWHLPIRMGFIALPLILFAAAESSGISITEKLNLTLVGYNIIPHEAWMAPTAVYGIYLLITLSWLSRKMEYEADQFASIGSPGANPNDMLDALIRFGCYYPDQLDKRSLLHPSLRQRMVRIAKIRDKRFNPIEAAARWRRQQYYLLASISAICFAAIML